MTFDEFMSCGRVRARMPHYRAKKDQAIRLCRECLDNSSSPYISLSGGKDSVAMAMLVRDAAGNREVRLWSHVSDASFPGTMETCAAVSELTGFPLDIYDGTGMGDISARKKQQFGKSGVFFDSVREYAKDKDLAFVGVRAYESKRRMTAAKVNGPVYHSRSMGDVTICNPLLWFRLEDVAAVLWEYNAPVHPIYRKMQTNTGMNGFCEDMFIRLGYITSKDLLNKGTAVFLRVNYPDKFNALAKVYPEIRLWV